VVVRFIMWVVYESYSMMAWVTASGAVRAEHTQLLFTAEVVIWRQLFGALRMA
jgi:hypothetical protein